MRAFLFGYMSIINYFLFVIYVQINLVPVWSHDRGFYDFISLSKPAKVIYFWQLSTPPFFDEQEVREKAY